MTAGKRGSSWRSTAIKAIDDPALSEKIASERLLAEAMKKPFPAVLTELQTP